MTASQLKKLQALANEKGLVERGVRLAMWAGVIGREVTTANDLTKVEAGKVIEAMETMPAIEVPK